MCICMRTHPLGEWHYSRVWTTILILCRDPLSLFVCPNCSLPVDITYDMAAWLFIVSWCPCDFLLPGLETAFWPLFCVPFKGMPFKMGQMRPMAPGLLAPPGMMPHPMGMPPGETCAQHGMCASSCFVMISRSSLGMKTWRNVHVQVSNWHLFIYMILITHSSKWQLRKMRID